MKKHCISISARQINTIIILLVQKIVFPTHDLQDNISFCASHWWAQGERERKYVTV